MSYQWIPSSPYSGLPANAVHAGTDSDGSQIYVGRGYFEGDQLPAKVIPSKQMAAVSHNGNEHNLSNFEVLTGFGFNWVASSNGHVPDGAVVSGNQRDGEPLYIGRAHFEGSLTPGKVHRSHGCLYIPYGNAEQSIVHYEVLVLPKQRCEWIAAHSGSLPPGAILAGNDIDQSPIYVGRAYHEGEQIPAKVLPTKQIAYVSYDGQEIPKHQFEVLCHGNVEWVHSSHGSVPPNAVHGGRTSDGEPLYVGRTQYQGSVTPGKVHPSHGSLYIAFGGTEIPFKNYEILVEH